MKSQEFECMKLRVSVDYISILHVDFEATCMLEQFSAIISFVPKRFHENHQHDCLN